MSKDPTMSRLLKELSELTKDPPPGCSGGVKRGNMYEWLATIVGPDDTPYAGGVFYIDITFPKDYPITPPKCKFRTKVYHPNIDEDGSICLNILKEGWTPALRMPMVLLSISVLLGEPNPDDPLRQDVAALYMRNRRKYDENARRYTIKHAMA